MSKYTSVRSFSAKIETLEKLEQLSKRYDLNLSQVITMLINQDYERLENEINGFVQTKIHMRSYEKRLRYSRYVNQNAIQYNIPKISHVNLEDESDLLCPDLANCASCVKRYIWRETTNKMGQIIKIPVGVKR